MQRTGSILTFQSLAVDDGVSLDTCKIYSNIINGDTLTQYFVQELMSFLSQSIKSEYFVLLRYGTGYVGFPEIWFTVQNPTCFKKLENTTCVFIYNLVWK